MEVIFVSYGSDIRQLYSHNPVIRDCDYIYLIFNYSYYI